MLRLSIFHQAIVESCRDMINLITIGDRMKIIVKLIHSAMVQHLKKRKTSFAIQNQQKAKMYVTELIYVQQEQKKSAIRDIIEQFKNSINIY